MNHDVYLTSGCTERAALDEKTTAILGPELMSRIYQAQPAFLGLDLPLEAALELMKALRSAGGRGLVVPSAYRQPRLSPQQAYLSAKRSISEKQARYFPSHQFNEVRLIRDYALWWVYCAPSPQLIEEGHVPGAVFAYVDKLDGRTWEPEEMEAFFNSQGS